MKISTTPEFKVKWNTFHPYIQPYLNQLRSLIHSMAKKNKIETLTEKLSWQEPTFQTSYGTPIRLNWKENHPNDVGLYFQCTSRMIPAIKSVYSDLFIYDKHRALLLPMKANWPYDALEKSISAALRYHQLKHLPTLGLND